MAKKISGKSPKAYFRSGIPVPDRPWFALTDLQKELRLDTVTWSEGHDIFLHDLLDHPVKRVRSCASSSNEKTMQMMIRAWKQDVDLAQVPLGRLIGTPLENWPTLPRAPLSYTPEPKTKAELQAEARAAGKKAGKAAAEKAAKSEPLATPALAGKFPDLSKTLDEIIAKAAEPGRKFKTIKPPAWATTPEPMPWAEDAPAGGAAAGHRAAPGGGRRAGAQCPLRPEDERCATGQGRRHQRARQSDAQIAHPDKESRNRWRDPRAGGE